MGVSKDRTSMIIGKCVCVCVCVCVRVRVRVCEGVKPMRAGKKCVGV